jgi:undecaprenyl-diphosphatase
MDFGLSLEHIYAIGRNFGICLLLLGFILFFISLTYHIERIFIIDQYIYKQLNRRLSKYSWFFSYIWPIGTTPVALMLVAMIFLVSKTTGFLAAIVLLSLAIIERIIKSSLARKRPFVTIPEAIMNQPKRPEDPSFPSGDAMRVWFLAISIPIAHKLACPAFLIFFLIGSLISLGRVALGVHYPLDVLGGIGLGILGAAVVSLGLETTFLIY